jgi:hypothetical protein
MGLHAVAVLRSAMPQDRLRAGDVVEVKSAGEILATLDDHGMLGGLPFMPEMLRYCGRRLIVDKRAEKICDTIYPVASRRLPDTVILGSLRCDGSGHDGCQADCRLFWKDAWLRRVTPQTPPPTAATNDNGGRDELAQLLARNTTFMTEIDNRAVTRYRCQNTELFRASQPLRVWDPRAYVRVYRAGNVGLFRFLRVLARAAVEEPMRKLGLTPRVYVAGTSSGAGRQAGLGLQPGDLVQVKSKEEIIATLDSKGKNRGLFFDREMLPYCGGTYRVKQRITRFIDDRRGGEMIELKSDCVTLDNVICSGELSPVRWFCPREIQSFWREIWLRRVDEPASADPSSARKLADLVHHPGAANQVDAAEA